MTKAIARFGLLGASIGLTFCNYWFTFGIWPQSWTSFFLCALGNVAIIVLTAVIEAEK